VEAAERFYQKSHEAQKRLAGLTGSTESVRRQHLTPEHRYYCVYEHLMKRSRASVVDLGFGTTRFIGELARFCRTYTIADIVDRTDGVALPDNVFFKKADLNEDFPFEAETFDCTVAMMIVEHLFDPFHSFQEITRITKHGGSIFINVPNVAALKCRVQLAFGKLPITSAGNWFERQEWDGNHLHYFTVRELVRLARIQGLKLQAVHPVGRLRWLKRMAPALLCHEISCRFSRP
jgi:SAM-dependent methyltransferase